MSGPMQRGPNTHAMEAPSDVTTWTTIRTVRDVPNDEGTAMVPREEWWEIPSFVADAARAPDPVAGLREAQSLEDVAREVVRFYGTDRTWSLAYRTLLGSRIDELAALLAALDARRAAAPPVEPDTLDPTRDYGTFSPTTEFSPLSKPGSVPPAPAPVAGLRERIEAISWVGDERAKLISRAAVLALLAPEPTPGLRELLDEALAAGDALNLGGGPLKGHPDFDKRGYEPAAESGLWADLQREAGKPGPTMTITKAQYGALLQLRRAALAASPAPEPPIQCPRCGGDGWFIDADPLPSGEPGEPYQVPCGDCGETGTLDPTRDYGTCIHVDDCSVAARLTGEGS